jgi:hypothetical protein
MVATRGLGAQLRPVTAVGLGEVHIWQTTDDIVIKLRPILIRLLFRPLQYKRSFQNADVLASENLSRNIHAHLWHFTKQNVLLFIDFSRKGFDRRLRPHIDTLTQCHQVPRIISSIQTKARDL